MKTKTYSQFIEENTPLKFVRVATEKHLEPLTENQYFALMVEDEPYGGNPHVKAIEVYSHTGLIGIEKTGGANGYYISKQYSKRVSPSRGTTLVVEVDPENLNKCCLLNN